eukprot:gb/GEZN01024645.1/.p1 GENE.gb/GEZN01024645.1/~~gb/GEZN01024645.1/.p1  ORF type:complete len:160 (+),score=45.15 gb/GEZN01024645.1/:45-524(+)
MMMMSICMGPPPPTVDQAWFPAVPRLTDAALFLAETRYAEHLSTSTGTDLAQSNTKAALALQPAAHHIAGNNISRAAQIHASIQAGVNTEAGRLQQRDNEVAEEDEEELEDSQDMMDAGMDDLEDEGSIDAGQAQGQADEYSIGGEDEDNADLNLSEEW